MIEHDLISEIAIEDELKKQKNGTVPIEIMIENDR